MANYNNLIRPPILGHHLIQAPQVNIEEQELAENREEENMEEQAIRNLIAAVVAETFAQQGPALIKNLTNPSASFLNATDHVIRPELRQNLNDLDKIPDVVRSLREFSGEPSTFNSWKKSVDRILEAYAPLRNTPKYFGILHTIRNKIIGNADVALESYNIPLDWEAISKCLSLHYADKRDILSLEYQMTTLVQGNLTVEEFYQEVYKHLALLLNKLGSMGLSRESEQLLTKLYRDKALDMFMRGLRGDLPRLLAMKEPMDLPSALHLCLKLENQTYRTNHATSKGQNMTFRNTGSKPIPAPRNPHHVNVNPGYRYPIQMQTRNYLPQQPLAAPRNNFGQQQITAAPRQANFGYQQQYPMPPSRPIAPKPLPRPEPMDVDPSIRTRMVNYINRPNFEVGKRPPAPTAQPEKRQRNFNIELNTIGNDGNYTDTNLEQYEQTIETVEASNEYDEDLDDYVAQVEENDNDGNYLDYSDLHFLG